MDTNSKLLALYKSKFDELSPRISVYNENLCLKNEEDKNQATNPLMLMIDEDWEKADLKVMIFGQENNFWGGECGNGGAFGGKINEVIEIYNKFYLKDTMYSCPFWNEFRRIRSEISTNDKKVAVLWNNIVKIGRLGPGFNLEIHQITKQYFNVIQDEIKILQPDLLIFFTGPKYNERIQEALGEFSNIEIDGFSARQMCNIEFKEFPGIKKSIRTYHPGYLYRNKNRRLKFINKILLEIKIFMNQ